MATNIEIPDETELQARQRIINNTFKDYANCIALHIDTHLSNEKGISPFGFHFELDKNKYNSRKEQLKQQALSRWFASLAFIHNKLGFRHVLLVLALALYIVIGGFVFKEIEEGYEMEVYKAALNDMNEVCKGFVKDAMNITSFLQNDTDKEAMLLQLAKDFYKDMLDTEDRYPGSVWHKEENLADRTVWSFTGAIFYSMTLFTTIGYGTIACKTWTGRWISILYATFGIPIMLLVLGDLGEVMQRWLVIGLEAASKRVRKIRKGTKVAPNVNENKDLEKCWSTPTISDDGNKSEADEKENEEEDDEPHHILPFWFACLIIILYVIIISAVIYFLDEDIGEFDGFDFQSSVYFVFISLTTIGLGDVMPNNIQYNPITAFLFLFGMALISIINSSIYSHLYEGFYGVALSLEAKLDAMHKEAFKPTGHRTFQLMLPAFRVFALSFPHSERRMNKDELSGFCGVSEGSKSRFNTIQSVDVERLFQTAPISSERLSVETKDDRSNEIGEMVPAMKIARSASENVPADPETHNNRRRAPSDSVERIHRNEYRGRLRAPTLGSMTLSLGGMEIQRREQHRASTRHHSLNSSDC